MITAKPITGRVSASYIKKADRFFNHTPATIITELIQNARRAGASTMKWTMKPAGSGVNVVIEDDGRGATDPEILLSIGESQWDAPIEMDEDPAGAGFYSLCGVSDLLHVSSKTWRFSATKDVFLGQREVTPTFNNPEIHGLRLEFMLTPDAQHTSLDTATAGLIRQWAHDVRERARYSGLSVTFNDDHFPTQNFLEGAISVQEYKGVRIGVFHADAMPHPRRLYDDRTTVNFYGCSLTARSLRVDGFVTQEGAAINLRVAWDVRSAQFLKFVLPQRDQIVAGTAYDDIARHSLILAVKEANKLAFGRHNLPYKTWLEYRALGIDLPEASPTLRTLRQRPRNSDLGDASYPREQDSGSDCRVDVSRYTNVAIYPVSGDERPAVLNVLAAGGLNGWEIKPTGELSVEGFDDPTPPQTPGTIILLAACSSAEGYAWYAKVPRVALVKFNGTNHDNTEFEVIVADDGVKQKGDVADCEDIKKAAKALHCEITITAPGRKDQKIKWEAPIFLNTSGNEYELSDLAWAVNAQTYKKLEEQKHTTTPEVTSRSFYGTLEGLLFLALHNPSDDYDSSSYEEQQERLETEISGALTHMFEGPEAELRRVICKAVDSEYWDIQRLLKSLKADGVSIHIKGGKTYLTDDQITIDLHSQKTGS